MDFHVGQTFGDYSVTAILGAGGMGRVYKVEHRLTKRMEAMKVLAAELATEIQIKRFEREMLLLARLNHPNIAVLHNALQSEKRLILLMEFIDGRTLESMFNAGRLPIETGIGYIRQVLSALRYAHQQGVVHRDVTPANVIVTAAGEVKLTDFGLAKSFGDSLLTNCGEILGSLPYMAPEQLKGTTQPDSRSDLYSVAAILYEHLTGQKPFGTNRRLAPVLTDSEGEPQPPSQLNANLAPQWDEIIRRALARDPARRYQSAEQFLAAIGRLDQTSNNEIRLPHLSKLAIGIAIAAGLVLALMASPALKLLRPVVLAPAPLQRLHIAPPGIASVIGPPAVVNPVVNPIEVPLEAPRSERIVRSAEALVAEPIPAAVEPPPAVETSADVNESPAPESADSDASQTPARPKRTFWSKLNVFKKKKSIDPKETQ
jgi:eukaryotic-like serine/threonine-protein kinase